MIKIIDINSLINAAGCFDLQFRQDIKHKRINSPTYYRWKVQFVITESGQNLNILEKIKNILRVGKIHIINNQSRYSVQDIDEIKNKILPYFEKYPFNNIRKKNEFELWKKAVEIIYRNKGIPLLKWKKKDFQQIIDVQKKIQQYKEKPKQSKWLSVAEELIKSL